jgi:hypothetical protein
MRIRTVLAACLFLSITMSGIYCIYVFNPFGDGRFPIVSDLRRSDTEEARVSQRKEEEARTKEEDARTKLAFKSLVGRLPKGKQIKPQQPLDAESEKRWEDLNGTLVAWSDQRADLLKALHERTRRFFLESPGQGSSRTFRLDPDEALLDASSSRDVPQPGMPADFPLSPGEELSRVEPVDEFHSLHEFGLLAFLNPFGFGYMKDREHVAGFESHRFRFAPTHQKGRWRIDHIQLVGILSHDQPVVYLTDKMPSMEQVRHGKTRGLDFFEEVALPALSEGKDLYIVQKNDTIRMLGAVRATKTCQKCHDAEVGDLLGAFSYTLRPAPIAAKGAD